MTIDTLPAPECHGLMTQTVGGASVIPRVMPGRTYDEFTLRGGGYKAIGAVLFGAMTILGASAAASGSAGAISFGVVFALIVGGITWRWIRAQVRIAPSGVLLRTPWRTHQLGWNEIAKASVVPSNSNDLFCLVQVSCTDGSKIKVDGVGSRYRDGGAGTPVEHAVDLINEYAAAPPPRG
jgi:hypothetical protein